MFEEFEALAGTTVYVSATPADYELIKSEGAVIEQLIRPTGLVDPPIDVRVTENQIDNLIEEIRERTAKDEKVLVTTLTKRMAEELSKYFDRIGIRNRYIHSEVDTLDRIQILEELREGMFDVLIGVNLLREGLDLPEVSLVAIMDADKEGFLRSDRALTQIAGRAARNVNGKVIMFADKRTDAMNAAINESNRRREKQMRYNEEHGLVPRQAQKSGKSNDLLSTLQGAESTPYPTAGGYSLAADISAGYSAMPLEEAIADARGKMEKAAKELDFITAAQYRNQMYALQEKQRLEQEGKK